MEPTKQFIGPKRGNFSTIHERSGVCANKIKKNGLITSETVELTALEVIHPKVFHSSQFCQ